MQDAYEPTDRSRVRRVHKDAHYDHATVHAILDAGRMAHVGYVVDGQPYVTATLYWRDGSRLYWHGSSASRMVRRLETGAAACVTVSLFDGYVLARSGFHCSVNYRTVMAFGTARALAGADEKLAALDAFLEHVYPGHLAAMRRPAAQEIKATTVVAMDIEDAAAKVRAGMRDDEPEDYAADCWAGVVPMRMVLGEPEPDAKLKSGIAMPGYLARLRPHG